MNSELRIIQTLGEAKDCCCCLKDYFARRRELQVSFNFLLVLRMDPEDADRGATRGEKETLMIGDETSAGVHHVPRTPRVPYLESLTVQKRLRKRFLKRHHHDPG